MPAMNQRVSRERASVFESVNQFIGCHTECSELGESLTYRVAHRAEAALCTVTVTCVCGATASFAGRGDEGRELSTVTRMHNIPTVEQLV
jgi:hypothetical protein